MLAWLLASAHFAESLSLLCAADFECHDIESKYAIHLPQKDTYQNINHLLSSGPTKRSSPLSEAQSYLVRSPTRSFCLSPLPHPFPLSTSISSHSFPKTEPRPCQPPLQLPTPPTAPHNNRISLSRLLPEHTLFPPNIPLTHGGPLPVPHHADHTRLQACPISGPAPPGPAMA